MRVERPADAEGYGQREECMTTARHTVVLIIALVSQSPKYLNTSFEQRASADRVRRLPHDHINSRYAVDGKDACDYLTFSVAERKLISTVRPSRPYGFAA